VRPAVVVVVLPFLHFLSHLIERPEDVCVEEFTPETAVQALDIRVLCRFAGLVGRCIIALGESDLSVFAPRVEALADKLRAVVHSDHGRKAAAFLELLKHADHPAGR